MNNFIAFPLKFPKNISNTDNFQTYMVRQLEC